MKIFIASSTENKRIAKWIEDIILNIAKDDCLKIETLGWWEDIAFPFGKSFYESLIRATALCEAAIIIAGQEDLVNKRDEIKLQPRDNLILELGLFAGKNGNEETLLACIGDTRLPTDFDGISKLILSDIDSESVFKKTNRSKIKSWLNQIFINKNHTISTQFPNLYKTIINIIEEIKSLKANINSSSVDILASNIFIQLTSNANENNYIAGFLVNRIENELRNSISIFATDVLGPSAWISPNAYRYLAVQIKYYIRKNTKDGNIKLKVNDELAKGIEDACSKVKSITRIGQSLSQFDNPIDFQWEKATPNLQFARILLWTKEELLSTIGDSIISIHQAFNVPLFFIEVSESDPLRESDFIVFEKSDTDEVGFYNSARNNFRPEPLNRGFAPGVGNCKKKFYELLNDPRLMLAIDARHILTYESINK